MNHKGCICIFAKPPLPGRVKTRLIPHLGSAGAAELATAFLQDTWASVSALPWVEPVLTSTQECFPACVPTPMEIWLQGEGDLGARLENILRRALREHPYAIALGADSPGLPRTFLEQARSKLHRGDAVIGPCDDGGFYLIGLRRCPSGLFDGISWSASDTFDETLANLRRAGMRVQVLEPWFDVDWPEDLARLQASISTGRIVAPHTREVLEKLLADSRRPAP